MSVNLIMPEQVAVHHIILIYIFFMFILIQFDYFAQSEYWYT